MSAQDTDQDSSNDRSDEIVQTQYVDLFQPPHLLTFASGETLGPVRVAYETYGVLNKDASNAIFICHALTGDAHAAGVHSTSDRKPGWWDGFIGPGKGIDTNKYYVICANVLGGCQGTTGPGCVNPVTGTRFCLNFPFLTVRDVVTVHSELARHLGIKQLLAVVGGSLPGVHWLRSYRVS